MTRCCTRAAAPWSVARKCGHERLLLAPLPEADPAHVVADLIGEEGGDLQRSAALVGIGRIEGGLRLSSLERVDDPSGVDDPLAVQIDHGQRPAAA